MRPSLRFGLLSTPYLLCATLFLGIVQLKRQLEIIDLKQATQESMIRFLQVQTESLTKFNDMTFKNAFPFFSSHFSLCLTRRAFMPGKANHKYTIGSDGKMTVISEVADQAISKMVIQLSHAELQIIINQIELNEFFKLNSQYKEEAEDGGETSLEIELGDQKKSVTVINSHVKAFDNISHVIEFIAFADTKKY